MAPDVDGDVRRQALKTLFSDPRYNVMDMMDVYVDDFSKPDPIPAAWMDQLQQLSRLGDRAGRDREEEERRKALAEATGNGPAPPADGTPEGPAEATAAAVVRPSCRIPPRRTARNSPYSDHQYPYLHWGNRGPKGHFPALTGVVHYGAYFEGAGVVADCGGSLPAARQ